MWCLLTKGWFAKFVHKLAETSSFPAVGPMINEFANNGFLVGLLLGPITINIISWVRP